jgi:nucleoporin SEH1
MVGLWWVRLEVFLCVCTLRAEHVSDDDGSVTSKWVQQHRLSDSRSGVSDIAFSPRHLGLLLAVASTDGTVRVYRAGNTSDLTHWELDDDILASRGGISSISWCDSRFSPPMFVVGAADSAIIWGYSAAHRTWSQVCELVGHTDMVHDVSWAPNVGRSFHLVGTASRDGTVRLWHVLPPAEAEDDSAADGGAGGGGGEGDAAVEPSPLEATLTAVLDEHRGQVWRVRWNLTGTTLATTGDDGVVRLWNQSLAGEWKCASTISIHDIPPE